MRTTDGVDAAYWSGSYKTPVERYQNGSREQLITIDDYPYGTFPRIGNYSTGDGLVENASHYNANVVIFG